MSDLFPPSLDDMIACAERELSYRRRVYARRVAAGQMTQDLADRELDRMAAIPGLPEAPEGARPMTPTHAEKIAALHKRIYELEDARHALDCGLIPKRTPNPEELPVWRALLADLEAGEQGWRPIAELVDRFLMWPLPQSVCSDGCVTDPNYRFPRHGTNLLTADEARQMIEYLLAQPPAESRSGSAEVIIAGLTGEPDELVFHVHQDMAAAIANAHREGWQAAIEAGAREAERIEGHGECGHEAGYNDGRLDAAAAIRALPYQPPEDRGDG